LSFINILKSKDKVGNEICVGQVSEDPPSRWRTTYDSTHVDSLQQQLLQPSGDPLTSFGFSCRVKNRSLASLESRHLWHI